MDPLGAHWFSKLEANDDSNFINQWEMKSINDDCFDIPHLAYPSSSAESIQEVCPVQKLNSTKKVVSSVSSTLPNINIISFGDSNSPKSSSSHGLYNGMHKCTVKTESSSAKTMYVGEMNFSTQVLSPSFIFGGMEYGGDQPIYKKGACNRTPLQAQDHVLAERKRRERLSERFVALSAMIPGLKKLDKASVLGGAIKYLKQLEERIKMLEDEKERKQEESAANISKRTRLVSSDETSSSSDENSEITLDPPSPEIEVRISDTNVLVRVYCEKRNGIIKEILGEVEKLHLGIISSSVIPFGSTTLNITVIAQLGGEDCMRAQEIANTIRMGIQKIM